MRSKLVAVALVAGIWLASYVVAHGQAINGVVPRTTAQTLNAVGSTTCTSGTAGCAVLQPNGYSSLSIAITGTWTGTILFESCTANCSIAASWSSLLLVPPGSTTAVTSTTANGQWLGAVPAFLVRARMSVHGSGSAVVSIYSTLGQVQPVAISSGGGGGTPTTPGGPDTSVQFNNAGAFAGASNMTFVSNGLVLSTPDNVSRLKWQYTGGPSYGDLVAPDSGRIALRAFQTSGGDALSVFQLSPTASPSDSLMETCNNGQSICPYWRLAATSGGTDSGFTVNRVGGPTFFQVDPYGKYMQLGSAASNATSQIDISNDPGGAGGSYVFVQGCDTTAANCAQLTLQDDPGGVVAAMQGVVPPTAHNTSIVFNDGLATQIAFYQLNTATGDFAVNDPLHSYKPGSFRLDQTNHHANFCGPDCTHDLIYDWTTDELSVTGTFNPATNYVAGGTPGKLSATTCTAFKFGICTAGTDEPAVTRADVDRLEARVLELEHTLSAQAKAGDLWAADGSSSPWWSVPLFGLAVGASAYRLARRG